MATALEDLRIGLCKLIGDYFTGTADSGSKTSLVDTELIDKVEEPSENQWIIMTGGTYDEQKRKIHSYSSTDNRIVWNRPLAGAISADDTYEITSFDPSKITDALNYAARSLYPYLFIPKDDSTATTTADENEYTIPTGVEDIKQVYLEYDTYDKLMLNWGVTDSLLEFKYNPTSGKTIRIIGMGYLSSVDDDDDEMEIDAPQTSLLYAEAATYLYRQQLKGIPSQSSPFMEAMVSYWAWEVEKLKKRVGMAAPALMNGVPDWTG